MDLQQTHPELYALALQESIELHYLYGYRTSVAVIVPQMARKAIERAVKTCRSWPPIAEPPRVPAPLPPALESKYFRQESLQSYPHERLIREGNESMRRIQRMLAETDGKRIWLKRYRERLSLITLVSKDAKVRWQTAQQIVDAVAPAA